jgi:hypothetical protein
VGDGDGNRDLSKVGLFCVRDVDEVCGGIVGKVDGNGGGAVRFCTRSVDECRYITHRENKALIEDQTYYINTPRAHTARLHPSLSMMCLQVPTEDDDNDLENRLQPMDVWVTYINAINAHEALNLAGSLAAKEGTRQTFAVTGLEEEDVDSNITPTDSTWIRVFAPSLSTFVRDVTALKTPGRPVRQRIAAVDGDVMTDEDNWVFSEIEGLDPEPSPGLTEQQPELRSTWTEQMASNWNKVRANLKGLSKAVTDCQEGSREGLEVVDQELSSIANKIALLDTRIGANPTASGIVSVWEAVKDVVLDG